MADPSQIQWMDMQSSTPGCPPGLEYLASIDQVIVKQVVELLQVFTGCETKNKYKIFNSVGQQFYYAKEVTGCCMRVCCGPERGFEISITDNNKQEVMSIIREFKCCGGCCWCAGSCTACSWVVRVEAPPGSPVGYVRQDCSVWKPNFSVFTMDDEPIARIHGPCCSCSLPCCREVKFPVMDKDDNKKIGTISKQWAGILKEFFTNADTFGITFPMDMDVRMKATLLGAMFLIDLMYFEKDKDD